jgi:hypothetical protein
MCGETDPGTSKDGGLPKAPSKIQQHASAATVSASPAHPTQSASPAAAGAPAAHAAPPKPGQWSLLPLTLGMSAPAKADAESESASAQPDFDLTPVEFSASDPVPSS